MTRWRRLLQFYRTVYRPRHRSKVCFVFHVAGATACLVSLVFIIAKGWWDVVWVPLVTTYVEAWAGHLFSWTMPASFTHPLYSAVCFWLMMWDAANGIYPWHEEFGDEDF